MRKIIFILFWCTALMDLYDDYICSCQNNKTFCTRCIGARERVAKSQLSYYVVVNRLSMVFELQDEKRNLKLCCRSLPLIGILYLFFCEILSSDKNGSASLLCNLIGGKCWMVFIFRPFNWLLPSIVLVIMWHFLCIQKSIYHFTK